MQNKMRNIWSIFVQLVTTWNENYQQSYKEETNSSQKFTLIPNFHKHLVLQTIQRMNIDVMLVVLSEELNIAKLAHYQQDVLINNQQPLNLQAYGRASKIIEVQKSIYDREKAICQLRQLEAEYSIKLKAEVSYPVSDEVYQL